MVFGLRISVSIFGLECRDQVVGLRFQVRVLIVEGSGYRVQGSGFRVQGSGFRFQGLGFEVYVLGFSV